MPTAVIARILLRYLSGALIAGGWLAGEQDLAADPDLVMLVGLALGAGAEVAYALARRLGWAK